MAITLQTPIVGKGGRINEVLRYLHPDLPHDVADYLDELYRLCELVGFDFRILAAQSAHETANWSSHWWRERLNPAGIGVTGDPAQNEASPRWTTGADAARAHVAHMWAYANDTELMSQSQSANALEYASLDPRFGAVIDAGFLSSVKTLGDLGNGKWATDPDYATKIAAVANRIFADQGETPMPTDSITYGRVPYPAVVPSHLDLSSPWVQAGAPAVPEAVFWHRMIGTWRGTDGWFHGGNAATAYGVAVAAVDGADAGRIFEWMSRESRFYGESSGPAVGPYGDGAKLIAKVGVGGINRTTKAIEISGNYDTPLDEAARVAIVQLTAYFADQRRIPWHGFPNVPGEDRSFVIWHNEITGLAYKACPGAVVMGETPALIQRVAALLKSYQAGSVVTKPPAYADPDLPDWWAESLEQNYPGDTSHDGKKFYVCRRNFVATAGTRRMAAPDGHAERSGPNVKVREKVHGERIVDNKWVITVDGHYVAVSKLSPRVTIKG